MLTKPKLNVPKADKKLPKADKNLPGFSVDGITEKQPQTVIAFQRDMKLNGISEFAVQRIVPLSDARFSVVYRSATDTQFRAYFCLPHTVHIAIQDGEFQSG